MSNSGPSTSVREIIEGRNVDVIFQPVVSIKRQNVMGVEAKFGASHGSESLSYLDLHRKAAGEGLSVELDRLLRDQAISAFKPLHDKNKDLLLFLNFDAAIVDQGVVGSGKLLNTVQAAGLNPNLVVIQIMESDVRDVEALMKFVQFYRDSGFLIGLGGVGSGHSNYIRIARTKPDILRIEASLVRGIAQEFYRREVFKSLVSLANNLGALAVAEGIVEEEEAVLALELGTDMLQGPFILESWQGDGDGREAAAETIGRLLSKVKSRSVDRVKKSKSLARQYERAFDSLVGELAKVRESDFHAKLAEFAKTHAEIECLYLLDGNGTQISDTVSAPGRFLEQRKLFHPADKGADHSGKDYFYLLMDTYINKFTTEPYTSMASGNLCVTISGDFTDADGKKFILCVDFPFKHD